VDSAPSLQRDEFLANVSFSLAELYSSALYLPVVEPDTAGKEETALTTQKWAGLFRSLKEKIDPLDIYWGIFDSTENGDPVQSSLAGGYLKAIYDVQL
jgi:hypothetical protein